MTEEEEERIAEVALQSVKVPALIRDAINDLKYLKLKGDMIKLHTTAGIMREALLKGVRLMLLEREIYNVIIEKEARAGAAQIYASLNKEEPVTVKPQAVAGVGEALEETGVVSMEEEEETTEEKEEKED